jgi:hypothetical protein
MKKDGPQRSFAIKVKDRRNALTLIPIHGVEVARDIYSRWWFKLPTDRWQCLGALVQREEERGDG